MMSPIEVLAVIAGILCVTLVVRQNIWCWPMGLLSVSLYVWIFFQNQLYSDVILHLFYVAMNIYGWYHWLHGGRSQGELPVTRLRIAGRLGWVAVAGSGTVAWGYFMATHTDASIPYGDAFTTVASLIAQWLMARKRIENWIFWIVVDVVAIPIYFYKELFLTSGLYLVYLGLSIAGFITWRRDLSQSHRGNGAES